MSPARKPVRLHRLSIGAALLAIAAAPFALTGPAHATTSANGCSVTPLAPVFAGVAGVPPVKQIRYNVVLACAPGRTVEVQQMFFEDDVPPDPDDFTGTSINTWNPTGLITRGTTAPLSNTEAGPDDLPAGKVPRHPGGRCAVRLDSVRVERDSDNRQLRRG